MLKQTTALASLAVLLSFTQASAETMHQDANQQSSMNVLPDNGTVSIEGVVAMVEDGNSFILQYNNGQTIDVESDDVLSLEQGDRVAVNGTIESEFLGLGKEISASNIEILRNAGDQYAADMTSQRSMDRNNMQNTEWHGGQYGAIDQLPNEGNVRLQATVASVDRDDNMLTVRDNTGETIDVHTRQSISANRGDRVIVEGNMSDELAGAGEQITDASVQVATYRQ